MLSGIKLNSRFMPDDQVHFVDALIPILQDHASHFVIFIALQHVFERTHVRMRSGRKQQNFTSGINDFNVKIPTVIFD